MSDITSHQPANPTAAASPVQVTPDRISLGFRAIGLVLTTAFLYWVGAKLLNDADTMWHIQVGRDFWASWSFPVVDSYSHTFGGEPWIAKQWLSGVLLAGAHAAGGWNGVVVLTMGCLLATFAQVHARIARHASPLIALLLALWVFAMASPSFLARPHVLALPVAVWFVLHVWTAAENRRAPSWIALGALTLWANMHGSFTLGFIAAGLAFLHFAVNDPDIRQPRLWLRAELWRRPDLRRWVLFGLLCPVAACIHPYGWHAILSTFVIADSPALGLVSEWRSYAFDKDVIVSFHLLVGLVVLLATPLRTSWPKALFVAFVVFLYFEHIRFVYLVFLLPPAVIVPEMAKAFPWLSYRSWTDLGRIDAIETMIGRASRAIAVVCLAAVGSMLALFAIADEVMPRPSHYPVAALDAVRAAGVTGPVMNGYNFGGALIYEGIPTFVDGRADRLYDNGAFVAEYIESEGDPDALAAYLEDYAIGWTLLRPTNPNVQLLDDDPNWTRLYADDYAVVHVPVGSGAN